MTYSELKSYFHDILSSLYTASETDELFSIFVEKICGLNKFEYRRNAELSVPEKELEIIKNTISELKTGKPYQQILGDAEFFGMTFFVDENVLIPRPETEELVELAVSKIKKSGFGNKEIKILDIGTGSGIIPIVLKKKFPKAEVSAIDFSKKALETARKNAESHNAEINFIHQDYLTRNLDEVYDIIISNPPYIGIDEQPEIADSVKNFEPTMALFSPTENPLIFYEKIAADCKDHLADNGMLFLEINQKLGNETARLFEKVLCEVRLIKDLSGNDRFVFGKK